MAADLIARTKIVEGLVTPAFIHNRDHYFVNLQVYADGLVSCWGLVDLAQLRDKLTTGWVTTAVPDGRSVSVHGLAAWTIDGGSWQLDADGLFARVTELVRELNPRMENLRDGQVKSLGSPIERPIRFTIARSFARRIDGRNLSVLVRDRDLVYLADLRAFADGAIELGRIPDPAPLDLDGVHAAVASGRLVSSVPPGTRVHIHELGSFVVAKELATTDIHDLVREVPDLIDLANGRPDSVDRCRAAHAAYLATPDDAHRELLRTAYAAVPAHRRCYVGDMDGQDRPVRRILGEPTEPEYDDDDDADPGR